MPNEPAHHRTIRVSHLVVTARVGVGAVERASPQELIVSIAVELGLWRDRRDSLETTVDYDRIVTLVRSRARQDAALIETFADRIVHACFQLSSLIDAVEVTIAKPSVLGANGLAAVSMRRARPLEVCGAAHTCEPALIQGDQDVG